MIEIKAPQNYDKYLNDSYYKIFLAGSIEMGTAENWQQKISDVIKDYDTDNKYVVLNPRRDDWDSSWVQSIDNPQFYEQVNWELQALEDSNLIIMYFDPNTKSPISLLELGIWAKSKKIIVCCPEGFWRKGNIDIVCERYGIPLCHSIDDLIYTLTEYRII